MADQGGGVSNSLVREYRKGNWTLQETVVLIEAKKMDDERRMKRSIGDHQSGSSEGRSKPTELRWKWVEDYCWRKGCFRSQNQCNDKWDNLMRDYKKVRDFERRLAERGGESNHIEGTSSSSYWKLEKNERKDKNLPSNMVPQIYEALVQVVERKGSSSASSSQAAATTPRAIIKGGDGCGGSGAAALVMSPISGGNVVAPPSFSPSLQHHMSVSISPLPLLPPPTSSVVLVPPSSQPVPYSVQQPLPTTVDSDTSEHSDSPAKRRRRGKGEGTSAGGPGGSGGGNIGGAGLSTTSNEVGTAISRSASIIAEAIQACEEREERRHRELLNLHERRLRVEEINRQGVNGLVDAITKLADSIRALASRSSQQTPPDQ